MATERIPHCCSQSASAFRSRVKVGKLRTGWGSRSALTATNNSLAPTSMPAASGCKIGNSSHRFLDLLRHWLLRAAGRMPKARIKSKLPIEIVVRADERHHTSVRNPRTHAYRRASESTNVGAGCSCHPTGANHHRSPRVPLHPVWQTPVARLWGPIWSFVPAARSW